MKRTAISILLACQCLMAFPVDYQTALRIASDYVDLPDKVKVKARSNNTTEASENFYIFNDRVQGNGFVIISGKDDTNPVLGYSDEGFADADNLPAPLQYFLSHAETTVQSTATAADATDSATPVVAPLIKTQWYQLEPYNAKTPGPKYFTGCVATAMAQVMNYHRWPERGHGTITYNSYAPSDGHNAEPVGELSCDLNQSVYDWDNMLATYQNGEWNEAQVEAITTLMRDCGYAAHMLYRTTESSSFDHDAATALTANFGYDVKAYPHYGEYDTETWLKIMKNEFDNGYPVIMFGQGGLFGEGGHCFIADGYDSNGFIHINWGWNGDADGYFNISMLTPVHHGQSLNYSFMQDMLTVHPRRPYSDATYNPLLTMLWDPQNKNFDQSGLTVENEGVVLDDNTPGQIRVDGLVYVSTYPISGTFNLVLTDADGTELKTVATKEFEYKGMNSKDDDQRVGISSISVSAVTFAGVADGDYRLVPVSIIGSMPAQRVQGYGYKNYVNVSITDGKVTLTSVSKHEAKLSVTRMMIVAPEVPLFSKIKGEIEISNSGNFIGGGTLYVYVDPQDGTNPLLVDSKGLALYENQTLSVPVEVPILPVDLVKADKEYTLLLELTGADKQPIELECSHEMPRFKVIYAPEYMPQTTITSLRIYDEDGKDADVDEAGVPLLDINKDYNFRYTYETTARDLAPSNFDCDIKIDAAYIHAGSTNEPTTGVYENKFMFFMYSPEELLGDHYVDFTHSDFLEPKKFISPQPANLAHYKIKFFDSSAGIDDILTEGSNKEIGRYNLQGIRVPADTKGFVIIYYSDGSRRKVFVK